MTTASHRYRLGFDIGGTFTDFVLLDAATGGITLHKCLTTPQDPAEGALAGIVAAAARLTLVDIEDRPIAHLPGGALRVRARVVGEIAAAA